MKKFNLLSVGLFIATLVAVLSNTQTTFAQGWTVSGTNTYTNPTTNKVGIGTTTPGQQLSVVGGMNIDHASTFNGVLNGGLNNAIKFGASNTGEGIGSKRTAGGNQYGLDFYTGYASRLSITSPGNVGIGTATPNAKLTIGNNLAGTVMSNTLCTNAGSLGTTLNNEVKVASLGFLAANNAAFGIRARRVAAGTSWYETSLGIGYDVDNTTQAGGGLWFYRGNVGLNTATPTARFQIALPAPWNTNNLAMRIVSPDAGYSMDLNTRVVANGIVGYDFISNEGTLPSKLCMTMTSQGNVGIGMNNPQYKLDICGNVRAKEIRVATGWCDYVFAKDYKLRTLPEVEAFLKENHHLPNIPSAAIVESEGLDVASMISKQMEKIEELTLYMIDMNKKVENLQHENEQLKQQITSPKN